MERREASTNSFSLRLRASVWVAAPLGTLVAMAALMLSVERPGAVAMVPAAAASAPAAGESAAERVTATSVLVSPTRRCRPAPGFFRTEDDPFGDKEPETIREDLVARIHAVGRRLEVVPALGAGIAWTESRFDPDAVSPDGMSTGAFQLTQMTAQAMRRRLAASAFDLSLQDEVTLGIAYLRYLEDLFARPTVLDDAGNRTTVVSDCSERWRFAIAAYNAGEGRVAGAQRRAVEAGLDPTRFEDVRPYLPRITRRYVDSVLTFATADASSQAS